MKEHEASRTLVKSAPELWAECSDAASLARHLGQFGEIRITRLEPETAVAWEGEHVSGTVRLKPSGWGTRVILTACAGACAVESTGEPASTDLTPGGPSEAGADPTIDADPDPATDPGTDPAPLPPTGASAAQALALKQPPRGSLYARLRRALGGGRTEQGKLRPAVAAFVPGEPVPVAPVPAEPVADMPPEPAADAAPGIDATAVLTAALDSLGQAHHRPFSRG
jgi:hypothetical protein